ncbi:hypothetical protein GCM10008179_33600 [Hansschlegelia plantiphila]|uniref:Uncharacterized protein n=1 Tax=Hansschlegelia plantiphila TaxID=374655 RepID=A0A9W6J2Z6_9HYPH|nr:hypothetical protein GCM10008179_33600 [Hansschlegelia plantiphila]
MRGSFRWSATAPVGRGDVCRENPAVGLAGERQRAPRPFIITHTVRNAIDVSSQGEKYLM